MSDKVSQAEKRRAGWRRSTRGCPPSASARTRRSRARPSGWRELAADRGLLVPRGSGVRGRRVLWRDAHSHSTPQLGHERQKARSRCCSVTHPIGSRAATPIRCCCSAEEFQRARVEVRFAKEPERGATPEDELLRG